MKGCGKERKGEHEMFSTSGDLESIDSEVKPYVLHILFLAFDLRLITTHAVSIRSRLVTRNEGESTRGWISPRSSLIKPKSF